MALEQLSKASVDAGLPLSRANLDRLASDVPVVFVLVGKAGVDEPSGCAALTFRDAATAQKMLAELGPVTTRASGASQRKVAGETLWTAIDGSTVFFAAKPEHIAEAGALALEGQRQPLGGLVAAVVRPDAIAGMRGTTVPAALGMLDGLMGLAMASSQESNKKQGLSAGGMKAASAALKLLLEPLGETQALHLGLDVGPDIGVLLSGDLEPKAGTAFAKRTAATVPYAIDPGLPVRSDSTNVFAWSPFDRGWDFARAILDASGPAGKKSAVALDQLRAASLGSASCVLELDTTPPTALCSWPLKPGMDAKRGLASYLAFLKASPAWEAEALGTKSPPPKIRKLGDIVLFERKLDLTKLDQAQKKMMRAMFAGETQRFGLTVRDGRVLQMFGPTPEKTLAALGKGATPAPAPTPPAMTEVLTRTKQHEMLMFVDLMGIVGFGLKNAGEAAGQAQAMFGAVPGLKELKAPIVLSTTGGKVAGLELQLPYTSLANAVKVARPYFGQMGLPATGTH
jgi:hypothetical protein